MDIYKSNYTGQQIDNFLSNANQATSDANSAAQLANSAAGTANDAADKATQAAQNANEAAASITQTLANKADLDPSSKTILPAEVAPLLGRQQGADTSNGYFSSTQLGSYLTSGMTTEILFVTGTDITTPQAPLRWAGTNSGGSTATINIVLSGGSLTAWYNGASFSIQNVQPLSSYHYVFSVDNVQINSHTNNEPVCRNK